MSDNLFEREFYLNLDKECQRLVDSWYTLFNKLKYYEDDCKFELPYQISKLKQIIFYMLQNYEENRNDSI
jgi:hypothetical protein